jgi:TatD DNase family protein
MIDSHCHLNLPHFDDDRESVMANAISDGVAAFMNIGYDRESLRDTLELLERYPFVFGAAGVHPHDAGALDEALEADVRGALHHPHMVAVGEIGRLSGRGAARREWRRSAMIRQLARRMPIVIHCRDSFNEVVDTLCRSGGTYRGVFHAFSAGEAGRAPFGRFLGIGGVITYQNARLYETVANLPIEKLVLETDSPYLTPHPWRGKRNEPSFVAHVLRSVARAKGMSPAEVDHITTENYFAAMGRTMESLPRPVYRIEDTVYIHSASAQPADLDAEAGEAGKEAVLAGFADPLASMERALALAARARERGWRVRVNTPGLANHVAGRDVTRELAGTVDEIVVPWFGVTAEQHDRLAFPNVGGEGWESMRDFVRCPQRRNGPVRVHRAPGLAEPARPRP